VPSVVGDVVEPDLLLLPAPDTVRVVKLQREPQQHGVTLADAWVLRFVVDEDV
jgi:hypothetical protein